MSAAREHVQKLFPDCRNPQVQQIALVPTGSSNHWIYVVNFHLPPETVLFPLPVLMNGEVVNPRPLQADEMQGFVRLNFPGTEVFQLLEVYRELAGGPFAGADLKVDKDVPLHVEITLESQSARKDEALRILAKALREQAGVVITQTATNQFSVSYDRTAKKK
jgi:hypothetical protein